uniref:ShKT domain-containing protein n=1 Tax=Lepeophtheirus salmonis TaxID=72036 RepID=A0A0K2UFQ1_LEPSM
METNRVLILHLLSFCLFHQCFGILSNTTCEDTDEPYCHSSIGSSKESCFDAAFQYTCPKSCGICDAKCRDNNGACYRDSIEECFEPQIANECPKSCAGCDECEDLISIEFCESIKNRCNTDASVRYSCRKTCDLCMSNCNNAYYDDTVCEEYQARDTCDDELRSTKMKEMCKKTCNGCE